MLVTVQLTDDFHQANKDLVESLDDKGRGYGVVKIKINDLTFGIPLRTNLNHRHCMVLDTVQRGGRSSNRGLDYTKALLIRDETKELGARFNVSSAQKKILISRKKAIINQFERYVKGYVSAVQEGAGNTLSSSTYKYSTLVNYHSELGI